MKKTIFLVLLLVTGVTAAIAQTGVVMGTQIRVANKPNGVFTGWTTDWIQLSGDDRPRVDIEEDKIGNTYYYGITFTYQGEESRSLYEYDGAKSAEVRKEWNKKVVNCYKDQDGNYLYVEDTSLQELVSNPQAWAKYPDAIMQFVNPDMNIAFK